MPTFSYTGRDANGVIVTGGIESVSREAAQNLLLSQGIIPKVVKEAAAVGQSRSIFTLGAKVTIPELLLFTKQLRTMINAGISITQVLDILQQQTTNPALVTTLQTMSRDIREGSTLSDAFQKHPRVFPDLYCSLIKAGELSGTLPDILERIIYITEHEYRLREEIKAALRYPKMVVFALGIAFFVLLTFVIPKFVGVFQSAGLTLPMPTRICLWMYTMLKQYWYLMLAGAAAIFFGLKFYFRTVRGSYLRDLTLLRLPIVGPLFTKSVMARFASILSILTASGVTILSSLKIISEAIGNKAIAGEFDRLSTQMEEGHGIAAPLREARFFPPMVVNMVAVGEESGSLEEMLHQIALHYDEEVEYATKGLSEAIGPILIVSLTVVVVFFALAIFLPMWDLTKIVK
ncbi:MAG: general secretion pathway protein GspF [Deltaproteobacteria bacterium CG23_combo_of_CG06-09_8_20_14_all_60_8]|nr:MAG: general secretion pathway protein GspF [Desulfobacterales bacterium CG2_30_60_27]PIP42866.1 MAG: general secretion pathway protein GspF [Deltaproteobacteria bacterium CG23_combo_of_CG06-09_8_20_14_all_60_8]